MMKIPLWQWTTPFGEEVVQEVELVHGRDIGGHNENNVAPLDTERCYRRGHLEASTVGEWPGRLAAR